VENSSKNTTPLLPATLTAQSMGNRLTTPVAWSGEGYPPKSAGSWMDATIVSKGKLSASHPCWARYAATICWTIDVFPTPGSPHRKTGVWVAIQIASASWAAEKRSSLGFIVARASLVGGAAIMPRCGRRVRGVNPSVLPTVGQ
jgi:hypothetical protein